MTDIKEMLRVAAGETLYTTPQTQLNDLKRKVAELDTNIIGLRQILADMGRINADQMAAFMRRLDAIETGIVKAHAAQKRRRKKAA